MVVYIDSRYPKTTLTSLQWTEYIDQFVTTKDRGN
jgi:hypothetical protein